MAKLLLNGKFQPELKFHPRRQIWNCVGKANKNYHWACPNSLFSPVGIPNKRGFSRILISWTNFPLEVQEDGILLLSKLFCKGTPVWQIWFQVKKTPYSQGISKTSNDMYGKFYWSSKTPTDVLTTSHMPRLPHLSPAKTRVLYFAGWKAIEKILCGTSLAICSSLIFRPCKDFL